MDVDIIAPDRGPAGTRRELMRRRTWLAVLAGAVVVSVLTPDPGRAQAPPLRVLAAAALEPGLQAAAAVYSREGGPAVSIAYATGPEILTRVSAGEVADLVAAPAAGLQALDAAHLLAAPPVPVGKVGVGVAVRAGAAIPDLHDVEALKHAVLAAKTVIYSRGSTGVYMDELMQRLQLADAITARVDRVANGGAVVTRLAAGTGDEIGFSATTELMLGRDKGVAVVGVLPAAVQLFTTYAIAPHRAGQTTAANGFLAFLASPRGRALIAAAGIEP